MSESKQSDNSLEQSYAAMNHDHLNLKSRNSISDIEFRELIISGDEDDDNLKLGADKVMLTCVGTGYTNMNKKTS